MLLHTKTLVTEETLITASYLKSFMGAALLQFSRLEHEDL